MARDGYPAATLKNLHLSIRLEWFVVVLMALVVGCAHERTTPTMSAGTGGIAGQLLDSNERPFDVDQAGTGGTALRIDLLGGGGVVATTRPLKNRPVFLFDNVPPGQYELSAYANVPGERTIAANQPVTVNAGEITKVKLQLEVTKQ